MYEDKAAGGYNGRIVRPRTSVRSEPVDEKHLDSTHLGPIFESAAAGGTVCRS